MEQIIPEAVTSATHSEYVKDKIFQKEIEVDLITIRDAIEKACARGDRLTSVNISNKGSIEILKALGYTVHTYLYSGVGISW